MKKREMRLARRADRERHTPAIEVTQQALSRWEARVDVLLERWYDEGRQGCCPECYFGGVYSDLASKAARTARQLATYLRKRGTAADLAKAKIIDTLDYPM